MQELEVIFREAMARVAAPVTVITTMIDGVPWGTTVSAFASLSVDPPMVFFALDNRGGMIDRIRQAARVGVNVLSGEQAALALRFAVTAPEERFSGVAWRDDHGLPRLADTVSWLRCEALQLVRGGDHTVVLATVADAETFGDSSLAYHLRQFKDVRPELG